VCAIAAHAVRWPVGDPKLGWLPIFGAARYTVLGDLHEAEGDDLLQGRIDRVTMEATSNEVV
jgi:hypothetical protein